MRLLAPSAVALFSAWWKFVNSLGAQSIPLEVVCEKYCVRRVAVGIISAEGGL